MGFQLALLLEDPLSNNKTALAIIPGKNPVLLKGKEQDDVSYEQMG